MKKYITWNQCDPVEGMEGQVASLCLKSESDRAVFALGKILFQSIAPLYCCDSSLARKIIQSPNTSEA